MINIIFRTEIYQRCVYNKTNVLDLKISIVLESRNKNQPVIVNFEMIKDLGNTFPISSLSWIFKSFSDAAATDL